jgi:hypothetical protein
MLSDEKPLNLTETLENPETVVDNDLQPLHVQAEESGTALVVVPPPSSVPAETPETPGKQSVYTVSVRLSPEEYNYFMAVLKARQTRIDSGNQPLSRDKNHLLKQCIRFTMNFNAKNRFWMPEGIPQTRINT